METHGPKVLGASYKNPIASFKQFHKFSVDHPGVSSCLDMHIELVNLKDSYFYQWMMFGCILDILVICLE